MTAKKPNRSDQLRQQRRPSQVTPSPRASSGRPPRQAAPTARASYRPSSVYLPVEPRKIASRAATSRGSSRKNRYDIAFTLGRADVRAPALTIPQFGPRWVSAGLSLLLCFALYVMWNATTFSVTGVELRGAQRLTAADVEGVLGLLNQPVFKAYPAEIETRLRYAYPDLSYVDVQVGFPNQITVDVIERQPVLAWYANGGMTWIDGSGVAFLPRGEASGLIAVSAGGTPMVTPDPSLPGYEQPYIPADVVQAIVQLAPYVPAGMAMTYDLEYGMGWEDPRGWFVYFGNNTADIDMKLIAYQSIVDTFTRQGIQPTMISVEYLDAPFYK